MCYPGGTSGYKSVTFSGFRSGNPTPVLRKEIWKSRTEDLSEENLNKLSEFELSGGQFDNIMRKATMNEILTEQKPDYNSLASLCAEEHLDSGKTRRMGFAV